MKPADPATAARADVAQIVGLVAAAVAAQLPFLGRPVNYDETNFLVLARGAALHPWTPHDIPINWQGTTERAFDVLSNPPGIAWFLAAVSDWRPGLAHIDTMRAWMLVWTVPAAIGAVWLARTQGPRPGWRAAALLAAPMAILSGSALLPDAPLYALTLLGMGGVTRGVTEQRALAPWALVAGSACLFRYSGIVLLPLVLLAGGYARRPAALWVLAPLALLLAHDLAAYGSLHLLAMGRFQSVSNTPEDWLHKAVSALTFLGGAVVLPLFRWERAHLIGAVIGAALAAPFGGPGASVEAAAFGGLGGAALASLARALSAPRAWHADRWMALWGLGGLACLLLLRFTAARYWLPFAPAVLLTAPPVGAGAVAVAAGLGVALLADDMRTARAETELAQRASMVRQPGQSGWFTGHWGWQHELEARGWEPLDEGLRPPPGSLVAIPEADWPQRVDTACVAIVFEDRAWVTPAWLPRAYSRAGRANLHANWIAGKPPMRTVIPWTFATDPVDAAHVCLEPPLPLR